MLEKLKEDVFKANLQLVKYGLVVLTWGNVSGIGQRAERRAARTKRTCLKPLGVGYLVAVI